jgi:ribosomal protein S18 acetylase RimI-like enzyme
MRRLQVELGQASARDAAAIARVHVEGWRWGYRGLLPETVLAARSVEERTRTWEQALARPEMVIYLASSDGEVVGFVACGPPRSDPEEGSVEIYALYQREQVAGRGVGHALLARALAHARAGGATSALLWVLASNTRARCFYELEGWRTDDTARTELFEGVELHELCYRRSLEAVLTARSAREADVPELLAMMADFNAGEGIRLDEGKLRSALLRLLADRGLGSVLLFELEPTVESLGYAVVTWGYDLEFDGRDAFLTELYLRPGMRGRGLGSAALVALEARARGAGAAALHLMVRPENAAALRLYRAGGYREPPRILMSRRLGE